MQLQLAGAPGGPLLSYCYYRVSVLCPVQPYGAMMKASRRRAARGCLLKTAGGGIIPSDAHSSCTSRWSAWYPSRSFKYNLASASPLTT
jgi:hypothetical protein